MAYMKIGETKDRWLESLMLLMIYLDFSTHWTIKLEGAEHLNSVCIKPTASAFVFANGRMFRRDTVLKGATKYSRDTIHPSYFKT